MSITTFNITQLKNQRLLISSAGGNQQFKDWKWFTSHSKDKGYAEIGVKFAAYVTYKYCMNSSNLEPALMLKSGWFRVMKNGRVDLAIGLKQNFCNLYLNLPKSPQGWRPHSGPPPLVQRRITNESDVVNSMAYIDQVILGLNPNRHNESPTLIHKESETTDSMTKNDHFDNLDISRITSEREKRLAEIAQRQGQTEFRRALLDAYDSKCAITGSDALEALDAVHILPDLEQRSIQIADGLLLRTDIHILFDQHLLSIEPSSYEVVLAPTVSRSQYGDLEGISIELPEDENNHPNSDALQRHFDEFMEKIR